MTDSSSPKTQSTVSRRTVVKGAAWAAPVVAMASAAPAFAASQPENTSINGYVGFSGKCTGWWNSAGTHVELDSREGSYGLFVKNTTITTTISNAFIIFYMSIPNLTWSTAAGNDGWTAPTSTGETKSVGGRELYGYKTEYNRSITATENTTKLGNLHVTAQGANGCPRDLVGLGERHVTVNGVEKVYDNGTTTLYLGGWGVDDQSKKRSAKSAEPGVSAESKSVDGAEASKSSSAETSQPSESGDSSTL